MKPDETIPILATGKLDVMTEPWQLRFSSAHATNTIMTAWTEMLGAACRWVCELKPNQALASSGAWTGDSWGTFRNWINHH